MNWQQALMLQTGARSEAAAFTAPQSLATHQLAFHTWPIAFPRFEAISKLYNQGFTDFSTYKIIARSDGCRVVQAAKTVYRYVPRGAAVGIEDQNWQGLVTSWDILQAMNEWAPTVDVATAAFFRGYVDLRLYQYWLRRNGVIDPAIQGVVQKLAQFIPPPQDLIRFAVREVFNPGLREALGLDQEFGDNKDYQLWARAQGIGIATTVNDQGQEVARDFAKDYWAAHWVLPSPTQAFEFLHRLRPGRVAKWNADVPGLKPFTMPDLKLLLKAQDYAPPWRDQLAAISYRIPGRIDLRRMFRAGRIGPGELTEAYRDLGYALPDAQLLTEFAAWEKTNAITAGQLTGLYRRRIITRDEYLRRIQEKGYGPQDAVRMAELTARQPTVAVVLRWYKRRVVTRDTAAARLEELGYQAGDAERFLVEADTVARQRAAAASLPTIKEALKTGIVTPEQAVDAMLALGLPRAEASNIVTEVRLRQRLDSVHAALKRVRRQYLTGYINPTQTLEQLQRMGLEPFAVEQYVARWEAELGPSRRELSGQQVVDLLKRGLIGNPEATRRLINLGYDDRTAQIMLLAGEQDRQAAIAQAAIRASRTAKEQETAALKAIKQAKATDAEARRKLAEHGSPTKLASWLKKGLITQQKAYTRLRALGWPPEDADLLIREALHDRAKAPDQGQAEAADQKKPGQDRPPANA